MHKRIGFPIFKFTLCGGKGRMTVGWKQVTCEKCLSMKPKGAP
jgi:hypothetical protein